eukprot:6201491-Pleurochrysis_carterae.AAC.1
MSVHWLGASCTRPSSGRTPCASHSSSTARSDPATSARLARCRGERRPPSSATARTWVST